MSDRPTQPPAETAGGSDAKPSIAEVAAWLRRAAESHEGVEELRPGLRPPAPPVAAPGPPPGARFGEAPAPPPADPPPAEAPPEPAEEPTALEEPAAEEPPVADEPAAEAPLTTNDEPPPVAVEAPPVEEPSGAAEPPLPEEQAAAVAPPPAEEPGAAAAPPTAEPLEQPPLADAAPVEDVVVADEVPAGAQDEAAARWGAPRRTPPAADAPAAAARANEAEAVTAEEATPEPAPAEEPPVDVQPLAGARRPWSGSDDDAHGAPAPAADLDADRPVVSPALALFASAVVRHNTAEVAAVKVQQEDEAPKVEPLVEDELPMAADEPAGTSPPDDGWTPAPFDQASADDEPIPDEPLPARSSVASLFDLDLAELAARARTRSGDRPRPAPVPESGRPEPEVAASRFGEPSGATGRSWLTEGSVVEAPDEALATSGLDLSWRLDTAAAGDLRIDTAEGDAVEGDAVEVEAEVDVDDAEAQPSAEPAAPREPLIAAAMARRRARRKRYPRGQLKEKIGFLRRVRAMLGVVVVTVLLGVAAGAAIGAFIVFLAFAIRSAITSS